MTVAAAGNGSSDRMFLPAISTPPESADPIMAVPPQGPGRYSQGGRKSCKWAQPRQ
jgi:hypothetical protein